MIWLRSERNPGIFFRYWEKQREAVLRDTNSLRPAPSGRFRQAEMTSQGLNGGALEGQGTYPAAIACILHGKMEPEIARPDSNSQPYVTQDDPDWDPEESTETETAPEPYITHIEDGGVIGYKYFRFDHLQKISIRTRGCAKGVICVRIQEKEACQIAIQPSEDWTISTAKAECRENTGILRMEYHGQGVFDLLEFSLE